jgi:probable rRNA maturation factor
MKVIVEINNKSGERIKKSFFSNVIKKTLELSEFDFLAKKEISVSVALVDEKEIKEINRIYRHKNQATDILSFAEYKNLAAIQEDKHRDIFLGELILCYNNIDVYAKKRGIKTEEEIVNVFSHGVLHLLGMRHGKKMFNIQKKVVKKIN